MLLQPRISLKRRSAIAVVVALATVVAVLEPSRAEAAKPKSPVTISGVMPQSSWFVGSPNAVSFLVRNAGPDPVSVTANLVVKAKKFSRTFSTQVELGPGAESSAAIDVTPEVPGKHTWKICIEGGRCSKKQKTIALAIPPPSATELIQDDLESGDLDYATSLIYRAYALVGDDRLPERYRTSLGHESLLIDEIRQALPDLELDAQAQLAPMLLRPNNPASPWSSGVGGAAARSASSAGRAAIAADDPPAAPDACQGSWDRSDDGNTKVDARFLVWACKDANSKKDIAWAVEQFKYFWAPQTAAMGRQIPGDGGNGEYADDPDDRVDIHLLPQGALLRSSDKRMDALGLAAAVDPDAPTSSSYIVIDRSLVRTRPGTQTVAHELFHAVQNAFGAAHLWHSHALAPGKNVSVSHWSLEASAVWAEAHFSPETSVGSGEFPGTYTKWYTNRYRLKSAPGRKDGVAGLNWPGNRPPAPTNAYASFIWFYYLEQELGVAGIRQVWNDLQGSTFGTADGALAGVRSFADNFKEFALRTVNLHLPGEPIPKLFDALPGTRFVTATADSPLAADAALSAPVPFVKTFLGPSDVPQRYPDLIPPLGAHFYTFVPEAKTRSVVFDISELQPSSAVALLKIDKKWERRDFAGNKLDLCLDVEKDEFDEAFIVVANHSLLTQASGAFVADARESCTDDAEGGITIDYVWTSTPSGGSVDSTEHVSLDLKMKFEDGVWIDDGGTWTARLMMDGTFFNSCVSTHSVDASGVFVGPDDPSGQEGEGQISFQVGDSSGSGEPVARLRYDLYAPGTFTSGGPWYCDPRTEDFTHNFSSPDCGEPGFGDFMGMWGTVTTDADGNQVADMACERTYSSGDGYTEEVSVSGTIPLTSST